MPVMLDDLTVPFDGLLADGVFVGFDGEIDTIVQIPVVWTVHLRHSPAQIFRALLVSMDHLVVTNPNVGVLWPVFVSEMPDDQDNCVVICDTGGKYDGRIQRTGDVLTHQGVQVRVRSQNYQDASQKTSYIVKAVDHHTLRGMVQIDDDKYMVQSINRTTNIMPMPPEEHRKRRVSFVFNARMTIWRIKPSRSVVVVS